MQRYFVPSLDANQIFLSEDDIFHITKVMRMHVGERISAVYNEEVYLGEIVSLKPLVVKNLGLDDEINRELDKEVTLFFPLAKGDKIDFIIQKATELGVSKIVLIKTEHCIVKMSDEDLKNKINNRYYRIAKEASEQSLRRKIPQILGVYDIKKIPSNLLADINYVCYEKDAYKKSSLDDIDNSSSVSILVGPEGGLSEKEVEILIDQDFKTMSLGKRILRVETAALAALAIIDRKIEQ